MSESDYYTIGMFQLWVNDRRRYAETVLPTAKEEEARGWIRLDAWIARRVDLLKARYPHQTISSLPLFCLFEEPSDD